MTKEKGLDEKTPKEKERKKKCHKGYHVNIPLRKILMVKRCYTHKYHIIVVRWTEDDKLAESKPCQVCTNILKAVGIKTVTYSDQYGNLIRSSIKELVPDNVKEYKHSYRL